MAQDLKDLRDAAILQIILEEKTMWEDFEVPVTPKVSFRMRDLIETCRKNYYGIFDAEIDPTTRRQKTWVPLTESFVEDVVKNNDIDTRDIKITARNHSSRDFASIVRGIVFWFLDKVGFAEEINDFIRHLAIDGTAVWKTCVEGKKRVRIEKVDILNLYFDYTARSIREAYRVLERSLLYPQDVQKQKWDNLDAVQFVKNLHPTNANAPIRTTVQAVDFWELHGSVPKWCLTLDQKDYESKEEVEARAVASGLEAGNMVLHFLEENKEKDENDYPVRPYEEAWYTRVPGRWHGRGAAEKIIGLQSWLNLVVNTRINRHQVSQLGIFKVRRGSGVTPQMLTRLSSNGAILVSSMDDIEQMVMQEASQSSYMDEGVIKDWAERVTAAHEVVTGEGVAASTTATAINQQTRSAQAAFVLIKEGIGQFIERWIKNHAMPSAFAIMKIGDVVKITGDVDALRAITEKKVNRKLADKLNEAVKLRQVYDPEELKREVERIFQSFEDMGAKRYFKMLEKIDFFEFDVKCDVGNEKDDPAVMSQNLIAALQIAPELKKVLVAQLYDLMGLDTLALNKEIERQEEIAKQQQEQQMMMEQQQAQMKAQPGQAGQVPVPTQAKVNATTLANAPRRG